MRHLQAIGQGFWQNREVMILARDLDRPGLQILHRMVATVMPELEPPRLCPARQRQ